MTDFSFPEQLKDRPIRRIVSLVPSITETLFDLNLGDRLVGITDYCIHPADKVALLPKIGGTKNPNIQQIIDLAPDLVLANQEENRREDVEALERAGIPSWVTLPKTVPETFNLLWEIMDVFHETSMVARIRLIEYQYDWVSAISNQREAQGQTLKVFCPIWLDPLMTFNADTYPHDILRVCGGHNIFGKRERQFPLRADLGQADPFPADDPRVIGRDTRYPRVTWEEVTALQPDVILLPNEPFNFTEAHIPLFKALDVPASHNNAIYLIDGSLITWHGTRIAYALAELPPLLYPNETMPDDKI